MIRDNDIVELSCSSLNDYEKSKQLVSLIKKEQLYIQDNFLHVNLKDYQYYLSSKPYLKSNSDINHDDYVLERVYRHIEHQNNVVKIVNAINEIILNLDRYIFIERFLYRKSIHQILQKYHLSQNYYYQALECAVYDFIKNIQ